MQKDMVVIGGGPGGAAIATLAARAGLTVALFEAQSFPRFQVGESLVPACNLTFSRLGLIDQMDARFPRKMGVQFFAAGSPTRPFLFSESSDPRLHRSWHVVRSELDSLMLDAARDSGVDVTTESSVVLVHEHDGQVNGVRVRGVDGLEQDVACRLVADASGQKSLLARRLGQREHIDGLENLGVFSHFSGIDRGDVCEELTLIYRIDTSSWFWFIPLPNGIVSIGLVGPAKDIVSLGNSPDAMFAAALARCAPLKERLRGARQTMEMRTARDFSYRAKVDGGPGWMLVGDALGFIDPVYSSGLFLALHGAECAADAAILALASNRTPDLAGYSAPWQAAFQKFLAIVRAYYSPDFQFGEFARDPHRREGLVDILTGNVGTQRAHDVAREVERLCGATR